MKTYFEDTFMKTLILIATTVVSCLGMGCVLGSPSCTVTLATTDNMCIKYNYYDADCLSKLETNFNMGSAWYGDNQIGEVSDQVTSTDADDYQRVRVAINNIDGKYTFAKGYCTTINADLKAVDCKLSYDFPEPDTQISSGSSCALNVNVTKN